MLVISEGTVKTHISHILSRLGLRDRTQAALLARERGWYDGSILAVEEYAMILIVGAGPAGLALGYELQRRGLPYRVLERNSIGEAWRNHYDRLHLHTLKQLSGLPGMPMPQHYPRFPSAAQFRAYLEHYAQHFRLNITCGIDVQKAAPTAQGWRVETNQGPFVGDVLVAATGIWNTPVIPRFNGMEQYSSTVIHSRDYRNAVPFRGKYVLVVGAGNSGSEIAVDLSEHGVVTSIAIRDGTTFVPYPRTVASMRFVAWLFRRIPRTAAEAIMRLTRRNIASTGIRWPSGPLVDAIPVVGFQLPKQVPIGIGRAKRSCHCNQPCAPGECWVCIKCSSNVG